MLIRSFRQPSPNYPAHSRLLPPTVLHYPAMKHPRLLVLISLLAAASASAQSRTRSVYAIRDAKIYPVSAPMIPRGTILIRNGLIDADGEKGPVPSEATVIQGSGLTVYPGLIDSFTDVGLPNAPP